MNKKILLVEDNQMDIVLTKRALNKANILNEVIVANDGEEALDYLFGKHTPLEIESEGLPVVVLLDIKMPKLSGLEVLKKIRNTKRTKLLPVVILTSSSEEKDLLDSYHLGANSYVQKPVTFGEFADAIKNLGLYWLLLNQVPATV